MPLTAGQTQNFFHQVAQMGIPLETVAQMQQEGIDTVDDLLDFDKDSLQRLADNLKRPGGRIQDPGPNAQPGDMIPTPSFIFGAKSHKRLLVACDLVKFYDAIGRPLTVANLQWTPVMRNFEAQWKALKAKKDDDTPDAPKITRTLPIMKWAEAFQDYLSRVYGVRYIPLAYVIRENSVVVAAVPDLAAGQPHSEEHGSVEADLVARASHNHALFRDDSASVYFKLEEATRATQYAASIKPFQRGKDGRGAWIAIVSQFAGKDKWEAEIKKQEAVLHTKIWKGQSNFTLEMFISLHRTAYVSLVQCSSHVQYQLPNEHSRVGYVINAIQCSDAELQAAMASVKQDNAPDGLRNDFEQMAAHLIPADPVAKKRQLNNKRAQADISSTIGSGDSTGLTPKSGIGRTGVHLRFHEPEDYQKLTTEQRNELRLWRKQNPDQQGGKNKKKAKGQQTTKLTKEMKAAVVETVDNRIKVNNEDADEDAIQRYIAALVQADISASTSGTAAATPKPAAATPQPTATKQVTLKSLLKQAKRG